MFEHLGSRVPRIPVAGYPPEADLDPRSRRVLAGPWEVVMAEQQDESRDREQVEVRRGGFHGHDPTPEQFLWRGRLFSVRTVLDHWVDSGTWCLSPVDRGGRKGPLREAERTAEGRVLALLDAEQALVALGEQREYWLVEASTGRHAAPGVYELSFDPVSTRWDLDAVRRSG